MATRSTAIAAALLLTLGSAAALAQTSATGRSRTQAQPNPPTVSATEPAAQNPLVNPDAAGTQMGWRGYGATSGATTEHPVGSDNTGSHPGLDNPGAVTPGAGRTIGSGTASPPVGRAATAGEARERLKQLGYSRITELHKSGAAGWVAMVEKGNHRQVRVELNENGRIVGER